MPKRQVHHRKGKLIQKNKGEVSKENFRVIAVQPHKDKMWVVGNYVTYLQAKEEVDNMPVCDIDYYVHNNSNRVLYQKIGEVDNAQL